MRKQNITIKRNINNLYQIMSQILFKRTNKMKNIKIPMIKWQKKIEKELLKKIWEKMLSEQQITMEEYKEYFGLVRKINVKDEFITNEEMIRRLYINDNHFIHKVYDAGEDKILVIVRTHNKEVVDIFKGNPDLEKKFIWEGGEINTKENEGIPILIENNQLKEVMMEKKEIEIWNKEIDSLELCWLIKGKEELRIMKKGEIITNNIYEKELMVTDNEYMEKTEEMIKELWKQD